MKRHAPDFDEELQTLVEDFREQGERLPVLIAALRDTAEALERELD